MIDAERFAVLILHGQVVRIAAHYPPFGATVVRVGLAVGYVGAEHTIRYGVGSLGVHGVLGVEGQTSSEQA
jgi:hypothetical protein